MKMPKFADLSSDLELKNAVNSLVALRNRRSMNDSFLLLCAMETAARIITNVRRLNMSNIEAVNKQVAIWTSD
jgi:hypothetical protein